MSDSVYMESGSPQTSPPAAEKPAFDSQSFLLALLRIFIYVLVSTGITFVLQWIMVSVSPLDPILHSAKNIAIAESSLLAGALAAGLALSRVEGHSLGAYGLPWRGAFGKLFWQGALFGLAEISAVLGAIAALGFYHFGSLAVHGASAFRWAAFWTVLFLMVGLYEEFAFRGYVQFTLSRAVHFWPAAVLLSMAFGAVHLANPGESPLGIVDVVLTGLLWCFSLRRTGNLWFAVGMHASFDFGETFLYSVPDSGALLPGHLSHAVLAGPAWLTGGNTGPEASVLEPVALLLLFYVLHRLYPATAAASERLAPGDLDPVREI